MTSIIVEYVGTGSKAQLLLLNGFTWAPAAAFPIKLLFGFAIQNVLTALKNQNQNDPKQLPNRKGYIFIALHWTWATTLLLTLKLYTTF